MTEFKIRKRIVKSFTETTYDDGKTETKEGNVHSAYDIIRVRDGKSDTMISCARNETVHRYFDEFFSDFTRTKDYDKRVLTPIEGYLIDILIDVTKRYNGDPDGLRKEIVTIREVLNMHLEHIEKEFSKV